MAILDNINDWIKCMDTNSKSAYIRDKYDEIQNKRQKGEQFANISAEQAKKLEELLNIRNDDLQGNGEKFIKRIYDSQMNTIEEKLKQLNEGSNGELSFDSLMNHEKIDDRVNISMKNLDILLNEVGKYLNSIQQIKTTQELPQKIDEAFELAKRSQKILQEIQLQYYNNIDINNRTATDMVKRSYYQGSYTTDEFISALRELLGIQATLKQNSPSSVPTNKDFGDAFENALSIFIQEVYQKRDKISNELIQNFFKDVQAINTEVTGAKSVKQDKIVQINSIGLPDKKIELTINDLVSDKNEAGQDIQRINKYKKEDSIFVIQDSMNINVESSRQGKMDVSWVLGDPKKGTFRISAKNWNTLSGHDLGDTSILRAIIRTTDELSVNNYEMGLQDKEINHKIYHDFAKLCIAVDIAMGYSQANGYANVLVIYDRKANYVYVRSINGLLNSFANYGQILAVQGYFDKDLEALAQEIRNKVHQQESHSPEDTKSTQLYYSYIHQVLNQIKVSIAVRADELKSSIV